MNRRMTTTIAAVVAALIGVVAALLLGPRPLQLGDDVSGDTALAAQAKEALGSGHEQVAVALVEGDRVRYAGFGGADERTPFEIGSVTKALTGLLLADMVTDGEVRLDQRAGELVPGTPLAAEQATVQELAQHRSGLPRLQPSAFPRSLWARLTGGDPYSGDAAEVLATAGEAGAPGRADPAYSNLGYSALGDALATKAGRTYGELLQERLLQPVGMAGTTVVTTPEELPQGRAHGRSASTGRSLDPWIAEGWAPAGVGTWSTAADLATLSQGLLDGSAPGSTALEPTADWTSDDSRIGLGWITSRENGRQITWHNGATSGFHAFVGLDRERDRAVVLLTASTVSADEAAIDILTDDSGATGQTGETGATGATGATEEDA